VKPVPLVIRRLLAIFPACEWISTLVPAASTARAALDTGSAAQPDSPRHINGPAISSPRRAGRQGKPQNLDIRTVFGAGQIRPGHAHAALPLRFSHRRR
jgi:hypothetical protein